MNKNELRAKIVQNGMKMDDVAAKLGISRQTLYFKMRGKSEFLLSEVVQLCDMLHIDQPDEKVKIFLA